jgi:hypothetical protein
MLRLGRMQIDGLFAHQCRYPLDDSEFIPLLDTLIEPFAQAGLSAVRVKELRRHVCEVYHRYRLADQPNSTFEANMDRLFSYLPDSARSGWRQWI